MTSIKSIIQSPILLDHRICLKRKDPMIGLIELDLTCDIAYSLFRSTVGTDDLDSILTIFTTYIADKIFHRWKKAKSEHKITDIRKTKYIAYFELELDSTVETTINDNEWSKFGEALQSFLGIDVVYVRRYISSFYERVVSAKSDIETYTPSKHQFIIYLPIYQLKSKAVQEYFQVEPRSIEEIVSKPNHKILKYNSEKGEICYE